MAKLRRRHIDGLQAKLENITDAIVAVRLGVERNQESEAQRLRNMPSLREDFVRIEGLLGGVKVALERMGGTTLPAFREDVSSMRAQMNELQHEMADYRSTQIELKNLAEALKIRQALGILPVHRDEAIEALKAMADEPPQPTAIKPKRRRGPGRPKDTAEHNTSQKLIDEVTQEVAEGESRASAG